MQFASDSRQKGWGLFPNGWIGEALRHVLDVWKTLSLPANMRLETRITKLLVGAIRQQYEMDERDWFVTVEDPDWNDLGKEISRTDIRLYPPGPKRHSVCFVFECKRLNTSSSDAARYGGAKGMMCFVTGKYSTGMPFGGMIGFVMDGNLSSAKTAVFNIIHKNRNRLRVSPNGQYQQCSLLSESFHGETHHKLTDGSFVMYHLLLGVSWATT